MISPSKVDFIRAFAKSCRRSIVEMVTRAQSGHPGGSLSSMDFLSTLYLERVAESNERVVVSNGHISPAIYSILAELGAIPKERVLTHFRRPDDVYEGHVNRQVNGVHFGTGPLGVGASVAAGMAIADRVQGLDRFTFLVMGDGEQQEGQVYEMMNFAVKYQLGNLIALIDFNEVQLSDSLEAIMPIQVAGHYRAAGWNVLEVDGHDPAAIAEALREAMESKSRPSLLLCKTVMGQGISFMESTGLAKKADWHGKTPKMDQLEAMLAELDLNEAEMRVLKEGLAALHSKVGAWNEKFPEIHTGEPVLYGPEVMTDCRSAYGKALVDLAKLNLEIVAMTADLAESVKTNGVKEAFPDRHIECGIAEQHMVSAAGGISFQGLVPFCSTFGAFMSSRAKDQARVNDINETNVKMVATHCGLSVGEDGPTHQAIDDIHSFRGFFNTEILEPADPNHCDRMIRYVARNHGNFYVRMGRAKTPVLLKEDGSPFFGVDYHVKPGQIDILRTGSRATVIAAGAMVTYAFRACEELGGDFDLLIASSFKSFDASVLLESARKTGKVVVVHDHHAETGLGSLVKQALFDAGLAVKVEVLGVREYQLSGTADELYEKAGMGVDRVKDILQNLGNGF